jgi:hypothetical protein
VHARGAVFATRLSLEWRIERVSGPHVSTAVMPPRADRSKEQLGKSTKRDEQLFNSIAQAHANGHISPVTMRGLQAVLRQLATLCGPKGLSHAIVKQAKPLHDAIVKKWTAITTRSNKLYAISSALRYDQSLGNAKTRDFWSKASASATEELHEQRQNNVLTARERESIPDLHKLREVVQELSRGVDDPSLKRSQELLWLMFALLVPPKRADFGMLAVKRQRDKVDPGQNAVVVPRKETGPVQLVLSKYKTSRIYGVYEEDLPAELGLAVRKSLSAHPRPFLFVNARGVAFQSNNSWTQWVKRTFDKYLLHKNTVTGLRKAWVQEYAADGTKYTLKQQAELAKAMLHSVGAQRTHYVHVDKSSTTHTPSPGT